MIDGNGDVMIDIYVSSLVLAKSEVVTVDSKAVR